jgi:hypothetical protein
MLSFFKPVSSGLRLIHSLTPSKIDQMERAPENGSRAQVCALNMYRQYTANKTNTQDYGGIGTSWEFLALSSFSYVNA